MKTKSTKRPSVALPEFYNDISLLETWGWSALAAAVRDRTGGFHTGTLATVTEDRRPVARTVVLREANRRLCRLRFHTDIASAKVAELAAQPAAMLHFYDPALKLQLQASGDVKIHHKDETAASVWRGIALISRRCYLGDEQPGAPAPSPTSGFPPHLSDARPGRDETEAGFENFAVACLSVNRLEALFLHSRGNRRAAFSYDHQGRSEAMWLVP